MPRVRVGVSLRTLGGAVGRGWGWGGLARGWASTDAKSGVRLATRLAERSIARLSRQSRFLKGLVSTRSGHLVMHDWQLERAMQPCGRKRLNLGLFRELQGIIQLDAEVTDGTLDLGVTQK